jgi:excisionase family DNA binding protein
MTKVNTIRLSVSETAKLFGVDQKTIRRAIKSQEIRYIVVRGRYKINFSSALKWSQNRPSIKNKNNKYGLGQYVDKWKINNKLYCPNPDKL